MLGAPPWAGELREIASFGPRPDLKIESGQLLDSASRCVPGVLNMAMPRPQWKGYLKLSLVSCPIALYSAISPAERISFRQVNRATGNRLRQQLVDAVTGAPVES